MTPEQIARLYTTITHKPTQPQHPRIFKMQSAGEWLKSARLKPQPQQLFGSLWHTGELSVLFADTGIGKTILAMQIADLISRGKTFGPFTNETAAQKVLYLDFELTEKQFQMRFTNPNTDIMHPFTDNFIRAEIESDEDLSDELIMRNIEDCIKESGAKCLVIDNITYLKNETEKGRNALPLMRQLNYLKKEYGIAILVLAHTPKRDGSQPITLNDLYGSTMIANFIDGCFALGRSSRGNQFRYVKQLKCRSSEVQYHANNVACLEIGRWDNRVQFLFDAFTEEQGHLKAAENTERAELIQQVYELADEGKTQKEIAYEIGMSAGWVNTQLKARHRT